MKNLNRRKFLEIAGYFTAGALLANSLNLKAADSTDKRPVVMLSGHVCFKN
jgi:hypothetical protein